MTQPSRPTALLLQLEFPTWATARPWTYSANFAVQEGLTAAGLDCVTVPIIAETPCGSPDSWIFHARRLLAGRTFDQVWVWLVHSPLDAETLEWIAGLAPVRVGILMESLRYDPDDYAWAPHLRHRQSHVEGQIRAMTHVLAPDERDADDLNARGVTKALWWPPMVPERFITLPPAPPRERRAVFHGTPYGPRRSWVTHPSLTDRLLYQKAGPATRHHRLFDELQQRASACLREGGVTDSVMQQYVRTLQKVRLGEFQEWMAGLPQWPAIVNLPSLAKFYGGRVFEGMAAGRPVISWKIGDHPRNLALFEQEKEILLFPADDPDALTRQIDRLREDAAFAQTLATNAHRKMLAYHTAERRLRDTLQWLATGAEPTYGIQPRLAEVTGRPASGRSEQRPHDVPVPIQSRLEKEHPGQDSINTTVFVLTIGDEVFASCQAALQAQVSCRFTLDIIKDVAPFNAAAQEMLRRCATPYFIQVDEDMILAPDAVATMEAAMEAAPDDVGMICFHLYDSDRERNIQGVKIYRTALIKPLSFRDLKASEMDLLEQMGRQGIRWILHPDVKGRHGTHYTIESIYRRYKTMYEKDIRQWNVLTADIRKKAERFRETGDLLQLFALLGAAHGIVHAPQADDREKDARKYDLPELNLFKRLFTVTPPETQPYDPTSSGTPVINQPIPFNQVVWKQRRAPISVTPVPATPSHSPTSPAARSSLLIVTPFFWPSVGGVERVVEQLSLGLRSHGYQIDIATYPFPGRTSDTYQGLNILTVAHHDRHAGNTPVCVLQVERLLRSGRYAACLLIGAPSNALFYGALTTPFPAGTKLLIQPTMNRETYEALVADDSVRPLFLQLAKQAHAVVALSEEGYDARFLREHAIAVTYMPNGTPHTEPGSDFRRDHGIAPDAFLVLHVANLYRVKNHLGLLKALPRMPDGAKLVLVGRPTEEAAYVAAVRETLATRPDLLYVPGLSGEGVAAAMRAADLLVLSSHTEAAPLCLLEAMSQRLPWLATPTCGSVNELAGGLIAPLESFHRHIDLLMRHPTLRHDLGAIGYEHWEACHRWSNVLQGWIDLIEGERLTRSFARPAAIEDRMVEIRKEVASWLRNDQPCSAQPAYAGSMAQEAQRQTAGPIPDARSQSQSSPPHDEGSMDSDRFYVNLFVNQPAWSTPHPNADEAARWSKIASFLEYILRRVRRQDPARQLRILDVGCGRGWLTNLATMYGSCEGIEPVAGVIDYARKLFPHLRFEAGTADSVRRRADFTPYDVVLTSEVIEHVPHGQKEAFLTELSALLTPDGYVILTTPRGEMWDQWKSIAPPNQPVEDWVTEEQLRSLFASQGFEEVGLERIHVEVPTLRYIPAPTPADLRSMNLLPIYQVWVCQRTGATRRPAITRAPKVSVIIPTYNRPDRLTIALASVLSQTFQDFEVIVVNDAGCAIDSVLAGCDGRERITTITHDRNRGLAAARNTGLRAAKGTYIAYLDDDDRYLPEHLDTLVAYLETNQCRVAYTDAWRVHETCVNGAYVETGRDVPYSYDFNPADLLLSNYFPVLCVMHERRCLDEVGCFDESLFAHEDWDLWIRMATRFPFKHLAVKTAEFTWRNDGSSMTSSARDTYRRTTDMIYRKYRPYAERIPGVREAQQQRLAELTAQVAPRPFDCSIVIPVSNKMELTVQCLTALSQLREALRYEVIVVDNGSTDGTGAFLAQLQGDVRVITNRENLGFAKACNQGARAARGAYTVFLNNDTIPLEGWLSALVADAEAHPEVGVLGSKLLYPTGSVQHAGVVFERTHLLPYHIYKNFPGDHPAVNQRREFQAVTGACLFIRTALFTEIGGFDEAFHNGFEDVDLCLKVRETGLAVVYQPRSVLYHLESQTPGRMTNDGRNAALFLERWGAHWWIADDDLHFHTDGYKLVKQSRETVSPKHDMQLLSDLKDCAAWSHVAATQAASLKKDWSAVRRELSLVQDWPNDPHVLSWAASVCGHMDDKPSQRQFLSRYLALADAPDERLALIRSLLAENDVQGADHHLQTLLAASPLHSEGLLLRGILCMQREQYLEAERAFSSALRQGADRKKCLMGMGMAALGRAYAQGAWERFLQVLAEHPDDAEAVHWLLRAGTAQNRWIELAQHLRQYVLRNPGDLAARFALAGVLVRAEQIDAARQEHDMLRALAPSYDGLSELGQAIAGKEAVAAVETANHA